MRKLQIWGMILLFCALQSCTDKSRPAGVPVVEAAAPGDTGVKKEFTEDTVGRVKATDYGFLSDSVFHGYKELLRYYSAKYHSDTCGLQWHRKSDLIEEHDGVKYIGRIRNKKQRDSVFVLRPFAYCNEDGASYYFTDTTLPRLQTESYCCHPDNLFLIGDINEDGISEICLFYSSCVSRFKALVAYTLDKDRWKEIGHCTFDVHFREPVKEKRVRKTGKGRFEMLEIVDKAEYKKWIPFVF